MPCPVRSLLRGADELGLRKAVKAEFGGGTRSFSCEEDFIYENVENELRFFTSQERQSIIRFWLQNLRAKQGEALHNVRFLEDQPISEQGEPSIQSLAENWACLLEDGYKGAGHIGNPSKARKNLSTQRTQRV